MPRLVCKLIIIFQLLTTTPRSEFLQFITLFQWPKNLDTCKGKYTPF